MFFVLSRGCTFRFYEDGDSYYEGEPRIQHLPVLAVAQWDHAVHLVAVQAFAIADVARYVYAPREALATGGMARWIGTCSLFIHCWLTTQQWDGPS